MKPSLLSLEKVLPVLCVIFFLLCDSRLYAQQSELEAIWNAWPVVKYLESNVTVRGIQGFKADEKQTVVVQWKETADGRFYNDVKMSQYGEQNFDLITCFDGQTYSAFDKSGSSGLLRFSKAVPAVVPNFIGEAFPFASYFCFVPSSKGDNRNFPGVKSIASYLGNAMKEIQAENFVESSFDGQKTRCLSLSGGFDSVFGREILYKVHFPENGSKGIIGWQRFSNNELHSDLIIKDWKSISVDGVADKKLVYPSSFIRRFYDIHVLDKTKPVKYVFGYDVEITAASASVDENHFVIDPSLADYVEDVDEKTIIRVPR